jgi:ribosomal protein S18 acetylase RimI-like enzyme
MSEIAQFDPHIRAIRLREDLRQIADLIEICFSQNIDAEGKDYIKHIRQTAENYSAFILENTTPENSSLPFHGYVWVENKSIVGNLTLIPLRNREKGSYFVANVAVHPDFRGRGIARQLTERAIQHVRYHRGKQIFLQVRDDNGVAIHLYEELGFDEMCRRTMWVYRPKGPSSLLLQPAVKVTTREKEDWNQQKLWLESLYPKEIQWNLPFRLEKMEPTFSNWITRFLYGEMQRTWSARKNSQLIGTVTMERSNDQHDYLWLASSPIWEDEVIQSVLPVVQKRAFLPKRLAVNYPVGRGRASFEMVNMHELNTLLWMKFKIYPFNETRSA